MTAHPVPISNGHQHRPATRAADRIGNRTRPREKAAMRALDADRRPTEQSNGAPPLDALSIGELAQRAGEQMARHERHLPCCDYYALELFRRAIVARDDEAWAAIYAQYAGLVRHWLRSPHGAGDELVIAAFERFWRALTAPKFAQFHSLAALLQYLKLCAQAARLDDDRRARRQGREEPLDDACEALPAPADVEADVMRQLDATAVWQVIRETIPQERARTVLYLSYVVGLSPRQICANYPAQYPDVAEVYTLKSRALLQLRRVPALREALAAT